ncbi:MBL fold metallo-hydrolase [Aeromicrobium sp. Leaf350]|uniref:MBL fold metallo-hydrolase n=1 Tax=Aeromicrobium sp. Leaf350 TaxID=2876565 RepID=UPI001E408EFC|nr:MBL fold metallo-hydrolase [Aeromicrobium sp. Leaf350]
MQITRFGHAAVLVEAAGRRVLVDPGTFSTDEAFGLTELDAVVVTHQHPDHLDRERVSVLLEANTSAVLLADPATADEMGSPWQAHVDGDELDLGGLVIRAAGAVHAEILRTIPRIANVGVLLVAEGVTLFHPGDSYATAPEGVDVLALPLAAPWAKVSETVDFVTRVAPRTVFPIHDRTVSDLAHGMYWGHVSNHGGVQDMRGLGQTGSTEVTTA